MNEEKAPLAGGALSKLPLHDGAGNSEIKPPPQNTQFNFAAAMVARRGRLVEHLHRLGPAPLGHFLREVENGASITDHLERYSRIDPEFVRALGEIDTRPHCMRSRGAGHDPQRAN